MSSTEVAIVSTKGTRNWMFVCNNPTEEDTKQFIDLFKDERRVKTIVYQLEQGKKCTPHLHGYVQYFSPRNLRTLKNINKRCAWFNARGTPVDNEHYCCKPCIKESNEPYYDQKDLSKCKCKHCSKLTNIRLDGPWKRGIFGKKNQGNRTDLDNVVDDINSNLTIRQIAESSPNTFIRFHSGIEKLKLIHDIKNKEFRQVKVIVYWGDTGTGKTFKATNKNSDWYRLTKKGGNRLWFDGYSGEKTLIIDDFKSSMMDITELLTLLDGYFYMPEIKGGHCVAQWTKVIITSNLAPVDWYNGCNLKNKEALLDRISKIKEFIGESKRRKTNNKEQEPKEQFSLTQEDKDYFLNLNKDN